MWVQDRLTKKHVTTNQETFGPKNGHTCQKDQNFKVMNECAEEKQKLTLRENNEAFTSFLTMITFVNDVPLKLEVIFFALCGVCLSPLSPVSLGSSVTVGTVLVHRNPPCSDIPACPTCPSCPGAASSPIALGSSKGSPDKWLSWSV